MIARLQQYLTRLSERERRLVLFGSAAALILLALAVLLPLQHSVAAASERVERKRDDLIWLRSVAPQLAALPRNTAPPSHESLVGLIDRTARQSGLAKSLIGSQPSGDGGLSVRLEQTRFDTLVTWLSGLREQYGVRIDTATIDAGNAAGVVNASLVLHAR